MIRKLTTLSGQGFTLLLVAALAGFSSTFVLAQNAPPKINWGNTETQTSPAPAGAFKQATPQQTVPLQTTQPAQNAAGAKQAPNTRAKKSSRSLSQLDDKVILIVGGKQTTAGAAKKVFQAESNKKIGGVKTVKSAPRKHDLSAYHVVSATQKLAAGKASAFAAAPVVMHTQSLSIPVNSPAHVRARIDKCQDKGPPAIKDLSGALVSGRQVGVYGRCFGDQTGSVELIGPFPGGKMKLPFNHWDHSGVILEVPANIRGVQDQTVSISVITAEGRASAAMPVKFVAAREYVEVPERFWSPVAGYSDEKDSSYDTYEENARFATAYEFNPAHQGTVVKSLRINPQCALDTMAIDAQAGNVTRINGWDSGPLYEANVSLDWVGACHGMAYTVHNGGITIADGETTINANCRIAFKARAWAYCPLGISP